MARSRRNLGALDRLVRIEVPSYAADPDGRGDVSSWNLASDGEVWAERRPISVAAKLFGAGEYATATAEYRIHYRADFPPDARIVDDGRELEIVGVPIEADSRREFLRIMTKEKTR